MKPVPRGAWQYGILLIILFAIAACASYQTIKYLQEHLETQNYDEVRRGATFAIWALTLGFMSVAAAFGMWVIQFSAEAEGYRRVGMVVENMHYLRDGLISLDKKGRVASANPAFKAWAGRSVQQVPLKDVFRCLSDADVALLMDTSVPNEVEREAETADGPRTLRFRSQPSSGMRLLLISDITHRKVEELQRQHVARLQLIGRIARGVAHDFNNILCSVSGHASLALRMKPGSPDIAQSMEAIVRDSQRGSQLANHLLELSRAGAEAKTSVHPEEHVTKAADLLRLGLSLGWDVQTEIRDPLGPVPVSGIQLEQAVLNIGILAANARSTPGVVHILAGSLANPPPASAADRCAVAVLVFASDAGTPSPSTEAIASFTLQSGLEEIGAIQSIVKTVVEDAGGAFDMLKSPEGLSIYRMAMPLTLFTPTEAAEDVPRELRAYAANWVVLLVQSKHEGAGMEDQLRRIGLRFEKAETAASALSSLDREKGPDAIIWDRRLLGAEGPGLLRIASRLCPGAGVVVYGEEPGEEIKNTFGAAAVVIPRHATTTRILRAMIDAKGLAVKRSTRA